MTARHFPRFVPSDLDEDQRVLYELIAGGPRASGPFRLVHDDGALTGPFNAMLLNPPVGTALQALGSALRYDGVLDDRAREIAILLVATAWDSAFERYAHEAVARRIGLEEHHLEALRHGSTHTLEGTEAVVAQVTLALVRDARLTGTELQTAREHLGDDGLYELTVLVGYYGALALQLRVFGDEVPD